MSGHLLPVESFVGFSLFSICVIYSNVCRIVFFHCVGCRFGAYKPALNIQLFIHERIHAHAKVCLLDRGLLHSDVLGQALQNLRVILPMRTINQEGIRAAKMLLAPMFLKTSRTYDRFFMG